MKNGLNILKSGGRVFQEEFKTMNGHTIRTRVYTLPRRSLLSKMGVDVIETGKDLAFRDKPYVAFRNKAFEYLAVGIDACKDFVAKNLPNIK